ncbi:hypothetical protein DCS_07990 [Drechmeria coniospora]|uniref:PSI domain-containing protein n=1 Tax=Drechmeria coniospora TaxID=98403 RepID=A0A151GG14_DRECN|nr:hypothetical protein DCS_07990 [Drechmeria coniospora]KYK56024.1 hypothetical protein DCS_07990 [Drechmeria coniospora]
MDKSTMDPLAIVASRNNFTTVEGEREHLMRCWSRQTCGACLDQDECSWCPFTWSCVPNSYGIPLLAPASNPNICPHPAERWELRTVPFGCHVSSVTVVTASIAIIVTALFVSFILISAVAVLRWRRYKRQTPDWRDKWRRRWREVLGSTENTCTRASSTERDSLLVNQDSAM